MKFMKFCNKEVKISIQHEIPKSHNYFIWNINKISELQFVKIFRQVFLSNQNCFPPKTRKSCWKFEANSHLHHTHGGRESCTLDSTATGTLFPTKCSFLPSRYKRSILLSGCKAASEEAEENNGSSPIGIRFKCSSGAVARHCSPRLDSSPQLSLIFDWHLYHVGSSSKTCREDDFRINVDPF